MTNDVDLITEQNELNFGKWKELIEELAKSTGKVQHPSFLTANDVHLPKFSGDHIQVKM